MVLKSGGIWYISIAAPLSATRELKDYMPYLLSNWLDCLAFVSPGKHYFYVQQSKHSTKCPDKFKWECCFVRTIECMVHEFVQSI